MGYDDRNLIAVVRHSISDLSSNGLCRKQTAPLLSFNPTFGEVGGGVFSGRSGRGRGPIAALLTDRHALVGTTAEQLTLDATRHHAASGCRRSLGLSRYSANA